MSINIIAAMDKQRAIGHQNKLLTHLPSDLKYFKELTQNQVVVMGRVTFESILDQLGHPLVNRTNLIVTNDYHYQVDYGNCYVYNSINDILNDYYEHVEGETDIWIIGGSQIYNEFLPHADKLYLTIIDHKFEDVDTYFPAVSDEWKVTSKQSIKADEQNEYDHHFLVYEKK